MSIEAVTDAPAFYVGDVPSAPLTWTLASDDETLEWVTGATASMVQPDGTDGPALTATADGQNATVSVTIPSDAFTMRGLAHVIVKLTGGTAVRTLAPLPIVVEDTTDGWATLGLARQLWPDAPTDPALLFSLLESARGACEAFAPAELVAARPLPPAFLRAQLLQAQATYTAMRGNRDGELGPEGYSIPVFPLDWNVKQLLRPQTGPPVIV